MKYAIFALHCLTTATIISSMEQQQKQITIQNINHPEISIDLEYYSAAKNKYRGCVVDKDFLEKGEKSSFNLYDPHISRIPNETVRVVPKIKIFNAIPQWINLNITEKGCLSYGDIITVEQTDETIIIANTRPGQNLKLVLHRSDIPFSIGNLTNTLTQSPIPTQKLTILNKDLLQVVVFHAAYRDPLPNIAKLLSSNPTSNLPCDDEESLLLADTLVKECRHFIRSNEHIELMTFSSNTHPKITDILTQLIIPQAAPSCINIIIDEEKIHSGDTLVVSYSQEDNNILITNQHKRILVKLYTLNHYKNQTTLP